VETDQGCDASPQAECAGHTACRIADRSAQLSSAWVGLLEALFSPPAFAAGAPFVGCWVAEPEGEAHCSFVPVAEHQAHA